MTSSRTTRTVLAGLALAASTAVLPFGARPASAAPPPKHIIPTVRIDAADGSQLPAGGWQPRISGNGRFVAYAAPGGQAFVKDLLTETVEMVSVATSGTPGNDDSQIRDISDDGNRVLFESHAHNLAPAPWSTVDLYLRDRAAHTTTRVNVIGGVPQQVQGAAISGDGKVVAFHVHFGPIWVKTLAGGGFNRVDVSTQSVPGDDVFGTEGIDLSQDGRYAAFGSSATNLVPGDTNGSPDIFRRDLVLSQTTRMSVGAGLVQSTASSFGPSISDDGRTTAFYSYATNLVPGDTNNVSDVFVHDSTLNTTERISVATSGTQADNNVATPQISGDGFSVVFLSTASNLAPKDVAGSWDAFVRDRFADTTILLDASTAGVTSNNGAEYPSINGDGTAAAFASNGTNLVGGDTNQKMDAFVRLPESIGPHANLPAFAQGVLARYGIALQQTGATIGDIIDGRTTTTHLIVTLARKSSDKDLAPVSRLYDAFFRRQPDQSGLQYWVTKHQKGTSLSKIATAFARSNEFKTKYGNTADDAFVKLVYKNVLDRQPDGAGLAHWVAKLRSGTTRGDVMVAFSESNEGIRHLAPEVDSVVIGMTLLGHMPDKALYAQAVAARKATGAAEGAAITYLESADYAH